jgi:hypothetical protein
MKSPKNNFTPPVPDGARSAPTGPAPAVSDSALEVAALDLRDEAEKAQALATSLEQAAINFAISIGDEALTATLISATAKAHFLAGLLDARARL